MSFRLRNDARKWFSEVYGKEPVTTLFDLYYFCLMAGLASGRSSNLQSYENAPEIIDDFIQDYRPAQRLLIGLLVIAEVRKGGIDLQEKAAVREVFKRLVTPDTKTGLTDDDGMRCLNAYASGGYEFLAESRETKPASPEEFLRDYILLMESAVEAAA